MAGDGVSKWDTALDVLFVLLGVGYILTGTPVLGVDPRLLGGVLAAYGVISFLVKRVVRRDGRFDRD